MPKINHEQILHEEQVADEELREQSYYEQYDADIYWEDYLEWSSPNHRPRWQRRKSYEVDYELEEFFRRMEDE